MSQKYRTHTESEDVVCGDEISLQNDQVPTTQLVGKFFGVIPYILTACLAWVPGVWSVEGGHVK